MAVHEKKESFKEHNDRGSILLAFYFVLTLLIPNLVLLYTEPYSIWSAEASLFIPMGFYLMWSAVLKRSGIMIWLAFPLVVLAAFQIVLLYLFGNSIIATDMFTNLLTTNPEEAGELLSNIYPSIIIVCAIYLPLLWFASRDIGQRHCLSKTARKNIALIGLSSFILGGLFLAPAYKVSEDKRVLKTDIFPVNVFYNIGLCGSEFRKMYRFEHTSEDFTYHARRTAEASKREIYVYVIGEASRAANWQLYGYHRETNPCLTRTEGLVVFRNTVTQSNTTHKSVPLILSSVKTDQHEELYRRKGLPALFKEAGFKTWFLSNQRPQGAMIDKLAKDADSLVYLPEPRYDMQLLEAMKQVIAEDPEHDLLIILHCYGSHFTYHQRYPREFARFLPDDNVAINRRTSRNSSMPTTIRSTIRTTSSRRRSNISARSKTTVRRCSTVPITAKIFSTTNGSASYTPPLRPLFISSMSPIWDGSRRNIDGNSRKKSKRPATTNPHRPQPTPCFKAWPISLRSKATSSIRPTRWSVRHSTTGHRAAI